MYVFNGNVYTNASATSDLNGNARFTLPLGSYRFRADFNGTQYWSGSANHSDIPGCTSLSITVGPLVTATSTPTLLPIPTETPTSEETSSPTETATPEIDETPTPIAGLPGGGKVMAAVLPDRGFQFVAYRNNVWQTQTNQVTIAIRDTNGSAKAGLNVYAFHETTYTGFSGTTNASGELTLTLPEGNYRFRADFNGTQFWSDAENHCDVPNCPQITITVTVPLTVTVEDTGGTARAGLPVYVFDGNTYTNFSSVTGADGQAVFTLPQGSYHFRADWNGTQFWSSADNACILPGCETVAIDVTKPVTVHLLNSDGVAQPGLNVYAFSGTTYTNFSAITDANGDAAFTLPQGEYRFRADSNGTPFWSAAEDDCALPGCESTSITVSKAVAVMVKSQSGQPYPNLPVFVFTGATYTGYSGTTDANGAAVFTLPQGEYHFRADYDGVQFWSTETDACVLPGCETAAVTLPGGTGESQVTIDYEYDALNRMTAARYSNGIAFAYTYDAVGNVLEYAATLHGQAKTTTYNYDAANQLLTAEQGSVIWHYEYDGNGSLIQATPGDEVTNGAKRYSYNVAGFLMKVETYTNTWQPQAEMIYDGLGNRLAMTGYTDGQSVTTLYTLENGQPLLATAGEQTTAYLYGVGVIGQQTDTWAYPLTDGSSTPRQLVDTNATVTLTASYTPWGDTLEVNGTGGFTFGYLGGIMDAATGLLYVGNGQYYDPQTGRFLTRNANPNQANPYVPWKSDPAGAMLAPIAMLALIYGGKRKRSKLDNVVIALMLLSAAGMSISACSPVNTPGPIEVTATRYLETPTPTITVTQGTTVIASTPTPSGTPTLTPSATCTVTLTPISQDQGTFVGKFNMSAYYIADEDETRFSSGVTPIPSDLSMQKFGSYLSTKGPNYYFDHTSAQSAKEDFLFRSDSVCMQGTGRLSNGWKISCTAVVDWNGLANDERRNRTNDPIGFEWAQERELRPFNTVARCKFGVLQENDELLIPELQSYLAEKGGEGLLKVTDTGGALCPTPTKAFESLDLFIGEGEIGLNNYIDFIGRPSLNPSDPKFISEMVSVYRR